MWTFLKKNFQVRERIPLSTLANAPAAGPGVPKNAAARRCGRKHDGGICENWRGVA